MVWMPECRVYVDGVEYTSDTVASVRISYGRTDITQNIRAATANFTILTDGAGSTIPLNAEVVITLDKSATTETIFTGVISDFTIQLESANFLRYEFTAVSPMAILGRTKVGSIGYSAESQGQRIRNILRDGSGTLTWEQTNITWAAATYPWDEGILVAGSIAGGWDFGAYAASEISAQTAIQTAAQFGFLFEKPDGTINFYDFYSRTGSSGYTVIDANETIRDTLQSELTTGQVVNNATITSSAGTPYTKTVANSITDYGQRTASFNTYMNNASQINTVLDNYVVDYAVPRAFVSGFTFPLSAIDTATRDAMISIQGNSRWQINGLPAAFGTTYKGIVEGWSWNIVKGEAFLSLYLSDWQLNQVFVPTP